MEDELTEEELDRAIELLEYAIKRLEEEILQALCMPATTNINLEDVSPN